MEHTKHGARVLDRAFEGDDLVVVGGTGGVESWGLWAGFRIATHGSVDVGH